MYKGDSVVNADAGIAAGAAAAAWLSKDLLQFNGRGTIVVS